MYVTPHFRFDDLAEQQAFIDEHDFGVLIVPGGTGDAAPSVSHLPFALDRTAGPYGTLLAHLAVPNPQRAVLERGAEALVVFSGPHAYVSPRWYAAPTANVPTWNYVAVHVHGTARLVDDPVRLDAILRRLTDAAEAGAERPWRLETLERAVHERMRRAISGIEIPIARIVGKAKLSQNRDATDRAGVQQGLRAIGDPVAVAVAEWMERGG